MHLVFSVHFMVSPLLKKSTLGQTTAPSRPKAHLAHHLSLLSSVSNYLWKNIVEQVYSDASPVYFLFSYNLQLRCFQDREDWKT